MTVETFTDERGRVRQRQLKEDAHREVAVARVVALSPPTVDVPGFGVLRIHARTVGLVPAVDDWVFVARVGTPKGERAVVLAVVELVGGD